MARAVVARARQWSMHGRLLDSAPCRLGPISNLTASADRDHSKPGKCGASSLPYADREDTPAVPPRKHIRAVVLDQMQVADSLPLVTSRDIPAFLNT